MPTVASSVAELLGALQGSAHLDGERLVIDDERAFRDRGIRDLAWTAAFTTDEPTAEAADALEDAERLAGRPLRGGVGPPAEGEEVLRHQRSAMDRRGDFVEGLRSGPEIGRAHV